SEESKVRPRARAADAITRHLRSLRTSGTTKLGNGGNGVSTSGGDRLGTLVHSEALLDIDRELSALRMRKSAIEIAKLRESLAVCDAAQAAVHNAAAEGATYE